MPWGIAQFGIFLCLGDFSSTKQVHLRRFLCMPYLPIPHLLNPIFCFLSPQADLTTLAAAWKPSQAICAVLRSSWLLKFTNLFERSEHFGTQRT